MSAQYEDNNARRSLPGVSLDYPSLNWAEPPLGEATAASPAAESAQSADVERRMIDVARKDLIHAGEGARTVVRRGRKQAERKEQTSAEAQAKPARAKRARVQAAGEGKEQAKIVSSAKRTSTGKMAKAADDLDKTTPIVSDIPPVTTAAIEFLGKQGAMAGDVLKLTPGSLAFVQHHFKRMHQLDADSRLMNAYLLANARPVRPALQKFTGALIEYRRRQPDSVTPQATAEIPEPIKEETAIVQTRSYGHEANLGLAYTPVDVQLSKFGVTPSEREVHAQVVKSVQDNNERARKVVGRSHISKSVPSNALRQQNAANLAAGAQAAYKAEEANPDHVERNVRKVENLIEQSPVQLVMDAPQTLSAKQGATSEHLTTGDQELVAARLLAEQRSAAPGPEAEKAASARVPRLNLGSRLLLAIGGVAKWAGTWLRKQGREGRALTPDALVPLEKSSVSTRPVVMATEGDDNLTVMPEAVGRRFFKIEHDYYFQDRTPAFSDWGNKLATRGTNPEVVRSLVEIAKARGWETITVKGTEEFRRSAWMEAAQNGMTVAGYKPTELDLAEMANRPSNNTVEKNVTKERTATRGQLARQPPVARTTSVPRPRARSKTPVAGAGQPSLEQAEKAKAFQKNKPAFVVKKYPDLAAAYGVVTAAEVFATEKLSVSARDEFVEMARRHVIQKIAAGEQIKGPKIYATPTRATEVGDSVGPGHVVADLRKSARSKAVERER